MFAGVPTNQRSGLTGAGGGGVRLAGCAAIGRVAGPILSGATSPPGLEVAEWSAMARSGVGGAEGKMERNGPRPNLAVLEPGMAVWVVSGPGNEERRDGLNLCAASGAR